LNRPENLIYLICRIKAEKGKGGTNIKAFLRSILPFTDGFEHMSKGGVMKIGVSFRSIRTLPLIILLIITIDNSSHSQNLTPRRIAASLYGSYFSFDREFFDTQSGAGAGFSLRYELGYNVFFENQLGYFSGKNSDGLNVSGMYFGPCLTAILPYLIPYRPILRAGVGFLSANPVTVTPTETFRPTQTTFYFRGGAGISRSIMENMQFELTGDVWITPYKYRIYRFNRKDVETEDALFVHLMFCLGVSYIF